MNTNGQANYADTTLKGTTTSYDALDRPTTVKQDSGARCADQHYRIPEWFPNPDN